jgi:hypothetical protein
MKIASLVCVVWMCSPLALQAGPAERGSAERGPLESSGHGVSSPAARARTQESTRVGSAKGVASKGANTATAASPRFGSVTPQRRAGQLARSNADRLRSLPGTQARAPAAKRSSQPADSSRRVGATGTGRMPSFHGANPVGPPTSPVSNKAARVSLSAIANPSNAKAVTRGERVGGPRPAGPGRLGGPATGRAATSNSSTLDGAQIRHRF